MADKKKIGGFKIFLVMMIFIVGGFFLVCGAWLILVPDSKIFGVSYVSHRQNMLIKHNGSPTLRYTDFSKIVVDTTSEGYGNAKVEVNYGMTQSEIRLVGNSAGFLKGDVRNDYDVSVTESSGVLTITLLEPKYNFLKLAQNMVVQLNISSTVETNLSGLDFEIKTNNGSITLGGSSTSTAQANMFKVNNFYGESKNGKVKVSAVADVQNQMTLISKTKSVTVAGNCSATTATLSAQKGKISGKNFAGDLTVISNTSNVDINNVTGNMLLDTKSGDVEIDKVGGNFQTSSRIKDTYLEIEEVAGSVSINNYESSISVDIDRAMGEVTIKGGKGEVEIGDIRGYANIATTSGEVDIAKSSGNTNDLVISTSSGAIKVELSDVLGSNTFTAKKGKITIKYDSSDEFVLNASNTKGNVTWKGQKTGNLQNQNVGVSPTSANNITATATSGAIVIGWL